MAFMADVSPFFIEADVERFRAPVVAKSSEWTVEPQYIYIHTYNGTDLYSDKL